MSVHVNAAPLSGSGGIDSATKADAASSAQGEWKGLAVSAADDQASLIADAAEELTFGASETVERKVAERKKSDKGSRGLAIKPPEEVIEKIQRRSQEKLEKLLVAVRAGRGNPAALRQALDAFSRDLSERHAAMLWLERELEGEPSFVALIRRERETLEAEHPHEIQAAYNIDDVDTAGMADRNAGKTLYQRTILGHGGMSAMLQEILERKGGGSFGASVDYLRRAVGADISAATPSVDMRELEAMNNDLYHLRAIGDFISDFDADLGKTREQSGKAPLPEAGRETLSLLCRVKDERLVVLDGLKTILALEGEKDPTYDVLALGQSQRMAHRLPAKVFMDEDSRQRVLSAGQRLLDVAVELEESLSGDE